MFGDLRKKKMMFADSTRQVECDVCRACSIEARSNFCFFFFFSGQENPVRRSGGCLSMSPKRLKGSETDLECNLIVSNLYI